jgi:hypothetical protein
VAEGGGLLKRLDLTNRAWNQAISGPFFFSNLVGVGCRWTGRGPGLGTLAGTPGRRQCVPGKHTLCYSEGR